MTGPAETPLHRLRVVDLVRGPLAPVTRILAELGARVDRAVEDADPSDVYGNLTANTGKILHGALGGDALPGLISRAHIVVDDAALDPAQFTGGHPARVWMTISNFGQGNSYSTWQATGPVLHALSGELSRSGVRGRPPVLPPGDLAVQCAATQAAYLLLAAHYRALRTGRGDILDFAVLDGAMQALDPGFGIGGSATMGRPARDLHRGRPAAGQQYPILPCADGRVRICLLAPRQWRGMFRWMGEPAAFAGPEFDQIATRYKSADLLPAIAAFFAGRTRAQLEQEGQAHGVPIAGLLSLKEYMHSAHAGERGALTMIEGPDGPVRVPDGCLTVDGIRMGVRTAAAAPDDAAVGFGCEDQLRPFAGLRVLDLGVIVVGAEAGRLLADGGADVVKVESADFPDGNRQSYLPYPLSVSFAAGHRNKRSLGLNLRAPEGRALFLRLAGRADVILSNFKPGTLGQLGLGYQDVAQIKPDVVMVDSSAFGAEGPWSSRLGYGPLVRASTGLTSRWRYPDDPESFSDTLTIYPDHAAGRISAIAAVALLIRRHHTGQGGAASFAQADIILSHDAAGAARLSAGLEHDVARDVPWGVFGAAGDDEFVVLTSRGNEDWTALCHVIGRQDWTADPRFADPQSRRSHRQEIETALAAWCAGRTPAHIAGSLQAEGFPAAPMLRVADQLDFPYFAQRGVFRRETHPFLDEEVIAERRPCRSPSWQEPPARPAPLPGEHSVEILREWAGLNDQELAALTGLGVVEPTPASLYDRIARSRTMAAAS